MVISSVNSVMSGFLTYRKTNQNSWTHADIMQNRKEYKILFLALKLHPPRKFFYQIAKYAFKCI